MNATSLPLPMISAFELPYHEWPMGPPNIGTFHTPRGALARRARAGRAPGIFFDPCPTGVLLGGALSAVRAQCNYLDV